MTAVAITLFSLSVFIALVTVIGALLERRSLSNDELARSRDAARKIRSFDWPSTEPGAAPELARGTTKLEDDVRGQLRAITLQAYLDDAEVRAELNAALLALAARRPRSS